MTAAQIEARPDLRPSAAGTAGLVAGGLALLILRPLVLGEPSSTTLLAITYLFLTATFVAVPMTSGDRVLSPVLVASVGLGGIFVARVAGGPAVGPLSNGPGALALGSMAAIAEEAFFRRFLYGRLERHGPAAAILLSALLFAAVHVPSYGLAVFWVDVGAGLLLSWQRWASGGWGAPAATHAVANILAVIR